MSENSSYSYSSEPKKKKISLRGKVSFNSPVTLTFIFLSLGVLIADMLSGGQASLLLFSVYRSSLANPLTYLRFFGHVLGHADLSHYMGNMMYLLILGPMLEEKYGKKNLIFVIAATALITGLSNFIFFPDIRLLGASGVVFAFILLSSFASVQDGKIPLTLILVAVIYIGQEVYSAVTVSDSVSQLTHIIGGIVGTVLGMWLSRRKKKSY